MGYPSPPRLGKFSYFFLKIIFELFPKRRKKGEISALHDSIIIGLLHTAIPDLVSSDTQVLNMSRTSLTGLPSRVFFIHNLTNIQRLHITQSSLAYIDDNVCSVILNIC